MKTECVTGMRQRIRSRIKGLAALVLAMVLAIGLMPAVEAKAAGENAYYLTLSIPSSDEPSAMITPGTVADGLGSDIDLARQNTVWASWYGNDLMLVQSPSNYDYSGVGNVLVDDTKAGGADKIIYEEIKNQNFNVIGTAYEGVLKKGNYGDDSNYSIVIENGERYFVDGSTGKRFKTYLNYSDYYGGDYLNLRYSHIMSKTANEIKATGQGSGTLYTIKTGSSQEKLYYAVTTSGFNFKLTFNGADQLSHLATANFTTKEIDGETYYNINTANNGIYTPSEITLNANSEYNVSYLMKKNTSSSNRDNHYAIDIIEIIKAAVDTAPAAIPDLKFNASAQALVTAGVKGTGAKEILYALGADASTPPDAAAFTASIPTGTDAGTYYVWYKAVGDTGYADSEAACVQVAIANVAVPNVTTTTLAGGTVGTAYDQALASDDNTSTWAVSSGALPDGLTLDAATGKISGTPLKEGTFTFEVTATNVSGTSAPKSMTITIAAAPPPAPTVTTATLTGGKAGTAYDQTLTSDDNTSTWAVTSGALPDGLTLDAATGKISGTPSKPGTFTFEVTATNATGTSVPKTLTITIAEADAPTPTPTPGAGNTEGEAVLEGQDIVDNPVTSAESANIANVAAAQAETGKDVKVTLDVAKKDPVAMPAEDKAFLDGQVTASFAGVDPSNVKTAYLEIDVTKYIKDAGSATYPTDGTAITDTGEALEIKLNIGEAANKNPVVVRRHGESTQTFTRLTEKPVAPFTDATYYVDTAAGDLYIYSRLFSTFALAYADNTVRMSFMENGGGTVTDIIVEKGKTLPKPQDPVRDGFTFGGWYADEALTVPFDFAAPVTGDTDITLYAKWIAPDGTTAEPVNPEPEKPAPVIAEDTSGGGSIVVSAWKKLPSTVANGTETAGGETGISAARGNVPNLTITPQAHADGTTAGGFLSLRIGNDFHGPNHYMLNGNVITILPSILNTLPEGTHIIRVNYDNDTYTEVKLTLLGLSESPKPASAAPPAMLSPATSDANTRSILLLGLLMLASLAGIWKAARSLGKQ